VYVTDADGVLRAMEFDGIGSPFDYPSYVIDIGPRGGTVLERA
jgi:hypothetical protein